MKTIKIIQNDDGGVLLKAPKHTNFSTFILGIEMLIETLMADESFHGDIDDILDDIRRIYVRDNINIIKKG